MGAEAPTVYVSLLDSAETDSERATTKHKAKMIENNLFFTWFSLKLRLLIRISIILTSESLRTPIFQLYTLVSAGESVVEDLEIRCIDLAVRVAICSYIILIKEDESVECKCIAHGEYAVAVNITECLNFN